MGKWHKVEKNKTKSGTDKRKNVKAEANKKQKHKVECLEHKKLIERSETRKQPPGAGIGTCGGEWGVGSGKGNSQASQAKMSTYLSSNSQILPPPPPLRFICLQGRVKKSEAIVS